MNYRACFSGASASDRQIEAAFEGTTVIESPRARGCGRNELSVQRVVHDPNEGALLKATLVAVHRTDIYRWMGVGLGIGTLILSVALTVTFVPRRYALGEALASLSTTFWGDVAGLLSFAIFLSGAVVRRRQPDRHRRLMLLTAISVVPPAISRILRWPIFEGVDGSLWALVSLSLLVGAMAMHDVLENRSVHPVTLLGGLFFLGSRAFAKYVVAPSDFGLAVVRGLSR